MADERTKTLVLTIEVPDYWADDLMERAYIWRADPTSVGDATPDELLDVFVNEEMDNEVVLVGKVLSQGEDPDFMRPFECRIVGVSVQDGRPRGR